MLNPKTKAALADSIYFPLRQSKACSGLGDADVKTLARRVVDHIELCRWHVEREPERPGNFSPGRA